MNTSDTHSTYKTISFYTRPAVHPWPQEQVRRLVLALGVWAGCWSLSWGQAGTTAQDQVCVGCETRCSPGNRLEVKWESGGKKPRARAEAGGRKRNNTKGSVGAGPGRRATRGQSRETGRQRGGSALGCTGDSGDTQERAGGCSWTGAWAQEDGSVKTQPRGPRRRLRALRRPGTGPGTHERGEAGPDTKAVPSLQCLGHPPRAGPAGGRTPPDGELKS